MFRTLRILRASGAAESAGELPPAAAAVAKSDAEPEDAQELVKARRSLAEKEKTIKDRETRIAHLEDENHRLKNPAPAPAPAPKKGKLDEWLY